MRNYCNLCYLVASASFSCSLIAFWIWVLPEHISSAIRPNKERPCSSSDFGLEESGFGLEESGFGLEESDFGLEESGFGLTGKTHNKPAGASFTNEKQ